MSASPTSNTPIRTSGSEWFLPPRWQTVCRLSRRIAWSSYRVERVRYRSEVRRVGATAYTQFATWAAVEYLARRAVTRARAAGEASIQSVGNKHESRGCRVKRGTGWGPSGKYKSWRC